MSLIILGEFDRNEKIQKYKINPNIAPVVCLVVHYISSVLTGLRTGHRGLKFQYASIPKLDECIACRKYGTSQTIELPGLDHSYRP